MSLEAQASPTTRTTCRILILLFIVISVQATRQGTTSSKSTSRLQHTRNVRRLQPIPTLWMLARVGSRFVGRWRRSLDRRVCRRDRVCEGRFPRRTKSTRCIIPGRDKRRKARAVRVYSLDSCDNTRSPKVYRRRQTWRWERGDGVLRCISVKGVLRYSPVPSYRRYWSPRLFAD